MSMICNLITLTEIARRPHVSVNRACYNCASLAWVRTCRCKVLH